MWMLVFAAVVSFSSCSDDDESKFDYPMDTLYGTWEVTEIMAGGTWYDVTKYPYDKFACLSHSNLTVLIMVLAILEMVVVHIPQKVRQS